MAGLSWMDGRDLPLVSLTFAREITPRQLLERMGADLGTRGEYDYFYDDERLVTVGHYRSWAWAWEHDSRQCVADRELVSRVSVGTAALVLAGNERLAAEFRYAEDGRLVTGFNTLLSLRPEDREGSEPHRFDAELRALGADPDSGDAGRLGERPLFRRLAERLGVGLPDRGWLAPSAMSARFPVDAM